METLTSNPLTEDLHQLISRGFISPNYLSNTINRGLMSALGDAEVLDVLQATLTKPEGRTPLFSLSMPDAHHAHDENTMTSPEFESLDALLDFGYEKVKKCLDSGTPAEAITLSGQHIGGALVARIAHRLHDEGHLVNLTLDRTFSRFSSTLSPALDAIIHEHFFEEAKPYAQHFIFGTSVAAFAIFGTAMGTAFAGLGTSLGVLMGSLVANIGYALATALSVIPGMTPLAVGINHFFNATATIIHKTFNVFSSLGGFVLGTVAAFNGALLGVIAGACLSLKLYLGYGQTNMPLGIPAQALLNTTIGDFTPIDDVNHISRLSEHGHLTIINADKDGLVPPAVALNTAFGLSHDPNRTLKPQGYGDNISSLWYKNTRTDTALDPQNIDHELTYTEPRRNAGMH